VRSSRLGSKEWRVVSVLDASLISSKVHDALHVGSVTLCSAVGLPDYKSSLPMLAVALQRPLYMDLYTAMSCLMRSLTP
jgi:hypothetical protein